MSLSAKRAILEYHYISTISDQQLIEILKDKFESKQLTSREWRYLLNSEFNKYYLLNSPYGKEVFELIKEKCPKPILDRHLEQTLSWELVCKRSGHSRERSISALMKIREEKRSSVIRQWLRTQKYRKKIILHVLGLIEDVLGEDPVTYIRCGLHLVWFLDQDTAAIARCSKKLTKTELRKCILENPDILQHFTLNDVKKAMTGPQWSRLFDRVRKLHETKNIIVPAGTLAWIERDCFSDKLCRARAADVKINNNRLVESKPPHQ